MTNGQYRKLFLGAESHGMQWPPSADFVRTEVIPRVMDRISEFGDGRMVGVWAMHSREVEALVCLAEGKCK